MTGDAVRVLIIEDDERISEIHRRLTEKVPGFEVVGMAHNLDHGQEMCEVLDGGGDIDNLDRTAKAFLEYVARFRQNSKR